MAKIIPYNPKLKALARKLRKDMTYGEVLLWNELKEDKLWGFDFDRQRCIDNYIVDFYCKDLMLAIEIDGMSHIMKKHLQRMNSDSKLWKALASDLSGLPKLKLNMICKILSGVLKVRSLKL
ncbi:MAG: hypothetical protein JWR12_612 [Mucilaginibacter sp.]|nr:hypothetical protein [Mucilaginibacter sp.]